MPVTSTAVPARITRDSHQDASPRNSRTGIPTGALNGTYDMIVSTRSLSLKKMTPKYGIITSIITGVSTGPVSSTRETSDAADANSAASSTNPTRKNSTNQA